MAYLPDFPPKPYEPSLSPPTPGLPADAPFTRSSPEMEAEVPVDAPFTRPELQPRSPVNPAPPLRPSAGSIVHTLPSRHVAQRAEKTHRENGSGAAQPEVAPPNPNDARKAAQVTVAERRPPEETLPENNRYTYVTDPQESHGLSDREIDAMYREGIKNSRDSASFDGERPLTAREEDAIGRLNEGLVRLGNEVGEDLRDRVIDPKHVHVFPKGADFRAAAKVQSRGLYSAHLGILVVEKPHDPLDHMYGIAHEGIHGASQHYVTPHMELAPDGSAQVDVAKSKVAVGYMHLGRAYPHAANEAATDMAAQRQMMHAGYPRITPGYGPGGLLLSGVIQDTADKLSRAGGSKTLPLEVENRVIKGMVSPDMTGIGMMEKALGANAVKKLMHTSAALPNDGLAFIARDIGSPTAEAALWARTVGVDTGWFTWR